MDFDFQLTQDFIFLLDLCKDPQAVFSYHSRECELAQNWLDKLCRYECENLNERRLRNVYMSHLCVCLNEGRLSGPFLQAPTAGKLEHADFNKNLHKDISSDTITMDVGQEVHARDEPQTSRSCNSSQQTQQLQPLQKQKQQLQQLSCQPQQQQQGYQKQLHQFQWQQKQQQQLSLHCDYENAYSPPQYRKQSETFCTCKLDNDNSCKQQNIAAPLTSTLLHLQRSMQNVPSILNAAGDACNTDCATTTTATTTSSSSTPRSLGDIQDIRQNVTTLLDSISSELRGELEPCSSAYLEQELSRYQTFVMNYSKMACILQKLPTKQKLRSFLLLQLQNDLVKLLTDIQV